MLLPFLDYRIFSKRAAGEAHAARNRFHAATRDSEVAVFNVIIHELGALLGEAQDVDQPEAALPSNEKENSVVLPAPPEAK